MNDQFIWNVNYNNRRTLEAFDRIKDINKKLRYIPMTPLTIEEQIVLREELMNIQVHAEMMRADLLRLEEPPPVTKSRLRKIFNKRL